MSIRTLRDLLALPAARDKNGRASYFLDGNRRMVTFHCMATVKPANDLPNWDTEAMRLTHD